MDSNSDCLARALRLHTEIDSISHCGYCRIHLFEHICRRLHLMVNVVGNLTV
jgi:hypothetical protein